MDYNKSKLFRAIEPYVKNKNILDIGCTGHDLSNINKDTFWIHDYLCSIGEKVKGIDNDYENVNYLKDLGYDIDYENAEKFIKNGYDVIFAGEIIEHLSNPGKFLECCRNSLKLGDKLIITTPNAYSISNILFVLLQRTSNIKMNTQHTILFTPQLIEEIFFRYGFKIIEKDFFHVYSNNKRLIAKLRDFVHYILPNDFQTSMLYILEKE